MRKRHRLDLLIWLALLGIALLEIGASFLPISPGTRPILALPAAIMAGLVAFGYMRLLSAPAIARGFAIASLFWLVILLGLAVMDPLTRAVYAVTGQIGFVSPSPTCLDRGNREPPHQGLPG
jgi:cytochrome c oxidase subunit IV